MIDERKPASERWEPTYYLKLGWTPLEVKGRMAEVDAAARELLGKEVFVIMPDGRRQAIGLIQSVSSENRFR